MEKVLLIATGGTIAMRKDKAGKAVPAVSGHELLESIPELTRHAKWDVCDFSNVASCNMDLNQMKRLASVIEEWLSKDSSLRGIVVTHGTDTLEETAYFLDITIKDPRPIILTASQRDASEADSDGPRNLTNAMRIALDPRAVGRGVVIALNEQIHAARDVRKLHTNHVDAFNSGEKGDLGTIDTGEVIWHRMPEKTIKLGVPQNLADVAICKVYTGMPNNILRSITQEKTGALVIEAFGRGNLPPHLVPEIAEIVERGIPVVITSRCLFGRTSPVYGYPGGGADLERIGAWFASDLSTEKVRLFLSIALGQRVSKKIIKEMLLTGAVSFAD
ncbi:L-asparaginase/GlutRNAGln amidotransferase subunit D [Desulfosporosinus acidiphilus SJ4]|uniref:asparaginase n=1 Tax=Desulfosporosinus acidiphilus (strain DSM 22704 / JCM 16185 / SJ4) TaxID=646529 RepID=I4D8F4_DESAJ|nr:asparaginase [Desulfosporosinus acidiphilus]AFM42078.1 L-asparaginase/GlutRNAGln amidotransferase subunit D [Desulfosporosinus acidiphilus SJ4]